MQRTLLLLVAVLLLGGVAYYVTSRPTAPADAAERDFGYADTDNIHRIFLADREGRQHTFERGGPTGWQVNGQPANENAMKNLLQAVQQIAVQTLPTSKAVPNLVRNLAGGGILVQLFDADGNKLRGYYVGGGTNGEFGTAAIMEESDNPYIVHLPMWTGNLRHRFNLRGDEWRDKQLFTANPDRVEYLSIEYPKQLNRSFRLERGADGEYLLLPLYGDGPSKRVSRGLAEAVLSRYERYYLNSYQNDDARGRTAAQSQLPFATIKLKEVDASEQVVKVYPRFQQAEGGDGPLTAYTAFINDDADWVLLSVETTQPLLVGYDSF